MSESKVYVGNLPLTGVDERDIRDLFEPLGPLRDVWVARKPPGFAFVTFEDPRDAEDAVEKLKNTEFRGQPLRIEISANRGRSGPRRDTRDRDFRGDRDRDRDYRGGGDRDRDRDRDSRRRSRSRSRTPPRRRSRSPRRRSPEDRERGRDYERDR